MKRLILVALLLAVTFTVVGDGASRRRLLLKQRPAAGGGFSPSDVSGMIFWLNTDNLSGSDGDAIQTFSDASGNNHNFSHATSGNRPLLTNSTSVMNNKKTLWFDGSADRLTNNTYATVAQNYTFYGVIKFAVAFNNFSDGYLIDSEPSVSFSIRPEDAGVHKIGIFDGTALREFASIADTQPRVLSIVMNSTGTALAVYTNGIAAGSATAWTQPSAGDYLTLGGQGGAGGKYLNGIIADTLLYSGAHGTSDRQNIEDYLGTKFGITINH